VSAPVWRLEWRRALRRRRLFVLNLAIPLLLVVPLALGGAPPFHAAAALAVLFVLFGTFGSAIPLLRDAEVGMLRRLLLAGGVEARILGERVLAGTALDTVQLAPSLVVVLLAWGGEPAAWMIALPLLFATLLVANLVGVWVAALARSLAEGALFAAVVSLFLLHGSGVFRDARPGGVASFLESALPYGGLHALLLGVGTGTGVPDPVTTLAVPAAAALLLLGVTGWYSSFLLERVAPSGRQGAG
jgi:ABC-2 type transport system permease protein